LKIRSRVISSIAVLLVFVCLALTGCKEYHWEIAQGIEQVESIDIINLNDGEEEIIKHIEKSNYEEIIFDIESLVAHKYIGSLSHPAGEVIKILFKNGDYDYISFFEPQHFMNGEEPYITWLCFNEKEFNQLIQKWMNK